MSVDIINQNNTRSALSLSYVEGGVFGSMKS
jgi:hypothetical protein